MNLKQINCFLRISEAGSFSKAADQLFITQPALSQQISRLEESLGVKLFHRGSRGVLLSEAGKRFLPHASNLIKNLDNARADLARSIENPAGQVTIGLLQSTANVLAVPIVEATNQAYPDIDIRVISDFSPNLYSRMLNGELDLAISFPDQTRFSGLTSKPLIRESLYVVARPAHPALTQTLENISLSSLVGYNVIAPDHHDSLGMIIEDAEKQARIRLEKNHSILLLQPLLRYLQTSDSLAILPWPACYEQINAGFLEARKITQPEIQREAHLLTAPGKLASNAQLKVTEIVHECVRDTWQKGYWEGQLIS